MVCVKHESVSQFPLLTTVEEDYDGGDCDVTMLAPTTINLSSKATSNPPPQKKKKVVRQTDSQVSFVMP